MSDGKILIKGNENGLNVVINMEGFASYDEMIKMLVKKLIIGKKFYKGVTLEVSIQYEMITEKELDHLKETLIKEIGIKEIILENKGNNTEEKQMVKEKKVFSGVYEGKTKFFRKTIRGGQCISFNGNIVIVGDINSGAEVKAAGNVIVLGSIKGSVSAGVSGNEKAIIAAFLLQPEILRIGNKIAMSPDSEKPTYPEVARIKDGVIFVEPYLPNKYIY